MFYSKLCQAGGGQPPPPVACPGESPCSLGGRVPGRQAFADVLPGILDLAGSPSRGAGLGSSDSRFPALGKDHPPYSCLTDTSCGVRCSQICCVGKNSMGDMGPSLKNPVVLEFCRNMQIDGSYFKIGAISASTHEYHKCKRTSCLTCSSYIIEPTISCYTTNLKFLRVSQESEVSCRSKNVIYLLTCKKCGVQYVGETKRELHCRYMEHVRTVNKNQLNTYLVKHFNQQDHSSGDLSVQIIEVIMEDVSKSYRENRELFWIKTLVTAFPFGLNDKINDYGNISNDLNPLISRNHPYFAMKMPHLTHKRNHKAATKKRYNKKINWPRVNSFCYCLINCKITSKKIYRSSCLIPKKEWFIIFKTITESDLISYDTLLTMKAITAAKFRVNFQSKSFPNQPQIKVIIPFTDKILDHINLNSLFKKIVNKRELNYINKYPLITQVIYKFQIPVGPQIFNYNKVLRTLNKEDLSKIMRGTCDCNISKFKYAPFGHVVTGDCEIVPDHILRAVLNNGTKFRIPKQYSNSEIADTCMLAFDLFFQKLKKKTLKIYKDVISAEEKNEIKLNYQFQVTEKIKSYKKVDISEDLLPHRLRQFSKQNKWIVTCADKAAGNFVFTCKKFYISNLATELGIDVATGHPQGNATYQCMTHHSLETIISSHKSFQANFGITVSTTDLVLPIMYAIPKLHKNPYKFRYIVGAKKSSIKPISCVLLKILKLFRSHFINYSKKAKNFTGLSNNWSINDSIQTLNLVNKIKHNSVKSVIVADFSTLYTMFQHDIVMKSLISLTDILFKNSEKSFVCIGYKHAFYSNDSNFQGLALDKNDILEIVNFVLDNTYFQFAGFIFKQICGIPMGGNASPLLADLTLSFLEFRYLTTDISYSERLKLSLTCRYIDDILSINCPNFMEVSENIYPTTIPLERTNSNNYAAAYLDLFIDFNNSNSLVKLFDKTTKFDFTVNKLVDINSNISSIIQYNIFYSQLLRFAKIFTNRNDFVYQSADLFTDFIFFGYNRNNLGKKLRKLYMNYPTVFLKFNVINRQELMTKIYYKIIV